MVEVAYKPILSYSKKFDTPSTDETIKTEWNRFIDFTSASNPIFNEAYEGNTVYVESIIVQIPNLSSFIRFYAPDDLRLEIRTNIGTLSHQFFFDTPLRFRDGLYIAWDSPAGVTVCHMVVLGYIVVGYPPTAPKP